MRLTDLRTELTIRGLPKSGNKETLIARIRQDDKDKEKKFEEAQELDNANDEEIGLYEQIVKDRDAD
jgi:hypothetical protein